MHQEKQNQAELLTLERTFRRGYHQAIATCLTFLETAPAGNAIPDQIIRQIAAWEGQVAEWRADMNKQRLFVPPPDLTAL